MLPAPAPVAIVRHEDTPRTGVIITNNFVYTVVSGQVVTVPRRDVRSIDNFTIPLPR